MATAIADFCQAIRKWGWGGDSGATVCWAQAALPSRASPLPQGEGVIAMLFCRRWLAGEICLEDSSDAIAGKPAPTGGRREIAVFFCRSWLAGELCLEASGAAIAGKPAPTGGGADCGVFL